VVELPTGDLHPDPVNPNRLDERKMAALKRDIVEGGFFRPVVVRPREKGGGWTIIDGEHRWKILSELGEPKTPCIVDDPGDDDAHLRMLTLNMLHGQADPVRQANLMAKIAKDLDEDELRERLGMGEDEYADALAHKNVGGDLDEKMAKALEREDADAPDVLRWKLGPRQAQVVERALDDLTANGLSRADALIKILEGQDG
jgi:ParB/RepB/Spo0J family partition protein